MGNQESRISSNYNIKNVVIENDYFSILEAVSKRDNSEIVSIFRYKNKLNLSEKQGVTEDINAILFKNAVQRIKTIRHPGIVKFLSADIYSESPAIVTANIIPLKSVLNDITPENLCTGIFNLLKTIEFLHQNCKLVYNNICLESIFVPKNNYTKWLIGEFQYSIPISISKSESQKIIEMIPSKLQPSKNEKEDNSFYRDYWLMGKLIEDIIEPYINNNDKNSKTTMNWLQLKEIASQMQNKIPQNRKSITEAINEPFFNNNIIIEVLEYLKNYKIKDENDKKRYLSILSEKMKLMSKDIIEKNILPEIIQKEIINESFSDILFAELFKDPMKGNALISEEVYKNKIIPYILEMMKIRQWGTRIVLLKLIDNYYDSIIHNDNEENKNKELVTTEILVGLEDMDPDIYINSFIALIKILMKTNLKNESGNHIINEKNNDEISSNAGSRKNSTTNEKPQAISNEKTDNSYLNVNVLINRFVIPHFIRMQISDNEEQKLESLKQVVELWKHYIYIEMEDLEVGSVAKSINVNILKTMKFIIKLFKPDEITSIFNDIFLKDILNNNDLILFGYYYISSYIIPLLVSHIPKTTVDIRNDEINILQKILNYLKNCSQSYLIEEDTTSNVKKLKNMYSNKFQSLEKYHFVKAGPVRKAEKSFSRNNLNVSTSSSFNIPSNNRSENEIIENISINNDYKNDKQFPSDSSIQSKDIEIKNKSSSNSSNNDINNIIIENHDNKGKNIDKSDDIPSKIETNNYDFSNTLPDSWDNTEFEIKNNNLNKTNDGWNFDWSDEENDNSLEMENEKNKNIVNTSLPTNFKNKEKIDTFLKEKNNNENLDEEKEEKNSKPIIPILTDAESKPPVKGPKKTPMKLGKKKENKESSLKKKLNDLNKIQMLKSQKKKEDTGKIKEIEDIMTLISNDSPNSSQKKSIFFKIKFIIIIK